MKLFGNRKGAEHIAARKTEKKTGGLKRWQRVTIIVAAIVLVLGGTALAVYKVNVKPPVKQPEPVETDSARGRRAARRSSSRARTATDTGQTRSSWRIWMRTRMRSL